MNSSLVRAAEHGSSKEAIIMSSLKYPFKWIPLDEATKAKKRKCFIGDDNTDVDMVRSDPLDIYMPANYVRFGLDEKIYNFELRPDDVWVVTFPKCGTTWMQEILWQMVNKLDADEAAKLESAEKVPFMEVSAVLSKKFHERKPEDKPAYMADSVGFANKMSKDKPRVLKSHMPIEFLPPNLLETNKGWW